MIVSNQNSYLIKQAGVIDTLTGIAGSIKDDVASTIEKEGAYSILTFLAPSMLGAIWGPLGWAAWMATILLEVFGLSIGQILKDAADQTKAKLDSGKPLTDEDAENISRSAVEKYAGPLGSTGSIAVTLTKYGVIKEAGLWGKPAVSMADKFFASLIGKGVGGSIAKGSVKEIFAKFLKWTIKNILKGAVLVGTAGAAVSALPAGLKPGGAGPSSEVPAVTDQRREKPDTKQQLPQKRMDIIQKFLTPTGAGNTVFINSNTRRWVVPLINSNVPTTMINWAINVYEEVEQKHATLIAGSDSFKEMVKVLLTNYDPHYQNYLEMPNNQQISAPINSVKDVVDYFIWETAEKIKGQS